MKFNHHTKMFNYLIVGLVFLSTVPSPTLLSHPSCRVFAHEESIVCFTFSLKQQENMEKPEVDSIVRDIFDVHKGSEKGKKKKTSRFFNFISGGESPLEAVQLALGRNEKLQYAQFKALTELVKFLENFNEVKVNHQLRLVVILR